MLHSSDSAFVVVSHFMIKKRGQARKKNVHFAWVADADAFIRRSRDNNGSLFPSVINRCIWSLQKFGNISRTLHSSFDGLP